MRNSSRRIFQLPVRASLANHTSTGAGACLRAMLVGRTLLAAMIAMIAIPYPAAQEAARSAGINIKQIQSLVNRGHFDAAEKQLWEVVVREPQNAAAINLLAVVRTKQKRYPEAEALFKPAFAIAPNVCDAYRNLVDFSAR